MTISYNDLERMQVSSKSLIMLLSSTQSFMSVGLPNHHQQVAYLTYRIGKSYGLDNGSLKKAFLSALIHDIGALSFSDMMELEDIEIVPDFDNNHATKGADLVESFQPFEHLAPIIRYHHYPWAKGEGKSYKGEEVPFESHLLMLADSISIILGKEKYAIKKMDELKEFLTEDKGRLFMPELVEAFMPLTGSDSLWLDFAQSDPISHIFATTCVTL